MDPFEVHNIDVLIIPRIKIINYKYLCTYGKFYIADKSKHNTGAIHNYSAN